MSRSAFVSAAAVGLLSALVHAQFDASVWPGFKGTAAKRASVNPAPGPAVNHAFTKATFATVSPGGFSVAANGDIYFKTYFANGTVNESKVYRLDPASGAVLAQSIELGGGADNFSGVAIGVDAVYTCVNGGGVTPALVKLNKSTLAVLNTFTNAAFVGLTGTPLISSALNSAGRHNLFVHDRSARKIHAVDSVTGELEWSYTGLLYDTRLGQLGPMWTVSGGRQAFACFENGDLGPGHALADNGDGTFEILWGLMGPESFNWWGSGALSADGLRIYVTTFNDNGADALWAIRTSDGGIAWSMPGGQGTATPFNFFARPATLGTRVYCGGGDGVIAAYDDNVTSGSLAWAYRDHGGEHTAVAVARAAGGELYVYAVKQDPGELVVLRDDGATYTQLLRTNLNGTMRRTFFGNSAATIDADGSVWVGGGRYNDATVGDIYKFSTEASCYPDCNNDGNLTVQDFGCFQTQFVQGTTYADCNGDGVRTVQDFGCFQTRFVTGCP